MLVLIDSYAHKSRCSTAMVEKIHTPNKDLASSRGQSKCRDIVLIQAGYEANYVRSAWEETGRRIQHIMDQPQVQTLMQVGRQRAGFDAPRYKARLGNPLYWYLGKTAALARASRRVMG